MQQMEPFLERFELDSPKLLGSDFYFPSINISVSESQQQAYESLQKIGPTSVPFIDNSDPQLQKKQVKFNQKIFFAEMLQQQSNLKEPPSQNYQKYLMQEVPIKKQNNNFPKLLLNRFFQHFQEHPGWEPEQQQILMETYNKLKINKFKNTNLSHFCQMFKENKYHLENRKLLYKFLNMREFCFEALLKSNAIKNCNKSKYLLCAKLAKIRTRSNTLTIRIQTNKENSSK